MKRYVVVLIVVGVIVSLLTGGVRATSNHAITINGSNDGWASDESFSCESADNAYFTWDADYIYFGISDADADYGKLATFIYVDTDPKTNPSGSGNGTTTGYSWHDTIALPFNADYTIVWKNESGNDYIEVQQYSGGSWNLVASATSAELNSGSNYVQFAIGTDYREVRIKRSTFGSPDHIYAASLTEQEWNSWYKYFFWPSDAATAGTGNKTLSHYFGFVLVDGIAPNFSGHEDTYPTGTNGSSTDFNSTTAWIGGVVPQSNTTAYVRNGHSVTLSDDATVKNLTILSGGTFNGGTGTKTLTIASGGTLQNNGAYTKDTEAVSFAGAGTIGGTIAFNNLTLAGTVSLSSGVTVNGTLTINANGAVSSNAPIYGSSSTLRYNSGGGYNVATEWGAGTSGAGVPQNVQTSSSGTNVSLTGSSARTVLGNVTIDASTTLALSSTSGGDLNVGGNWTNNGTFTHNDRTVTFNGSGTSTYGGSSTTTFYDIIVNSGATVDVGTNTLFNASNSVTNNGTLQQTKTVGAGATVDFLNVSTNKYYGLSIIAPTLSANVASAAGAAAPSAGLGDVTVKVLGGGVCGNMHANSKPVKRCYTITTASGGTATATFYYRFLDLQASQNPANLKLWQYQSGTTWSEPSGLTYANSTCVSGDNNCYVRVTNLTLPAGESRFALMETNPTAAVLSSFAAAAERGGVTVTWETASELGNLGFNLYRAAAVDGPWARVNPAVIPGRSPGSPEGFTYTWADRPPARGLYWYRLVGVGMNGVETELDTVSVSYPYGWLWLPLLAR
ncbi:MAG: hypothetical protein NT169_22290 [Chloroflexi bacterium]|nr:hypothetical protein [Chloroflexota bacterium]